MRSVSTRQFSTNSLETIRSNAAARWLRSTNSSVCTNTLAPFARPVPPRPPAAAPRARAGCPARVQRATRKRAGAAVPAQRGRACCRSGPEVLDESVRQGSSVANVADLLADVCADFAHEGALGVLYVDCAALDGVERRYGEEAHRRTLASVADVVGGACIEVLGERETLARGETGRGELIAFVTRKPGDVDFHAKLLAALERSARERLARNSQRVAYPYLRQIPMLPIGCAFTLRNPILSPTTQVREAMDGARADAGLNARIAQRTRRRDFIDILLQGKLFSVYEPVVDAKTLTVFGYEALVRGSEGSGLASPAELFGVASEEGLLFELDCQCRRAAVEGAAGFPAGAKLFMNIRPTAIHDPSFQPDALTRTLERCGLSPTDVVFEISEQESIDNYTIFREARDNYGK